MPSSSSSLNTKIKEKLSPEEAVQLFELLGREIPIAQYVKFVNERTGEEMDINDVIKQQQPKQSSCYDYFLDYMNCHQHVSNVLKQSKRNHTLKLNEPDLKVSSVCNKAYQMYEKCTFQAVPDATATAEPATLKQSLLQHFVQDLEYYHTTTLTKAEQVELSVKMLHDPSLQAQWNEMKSNITEQDRADYKKFVQQEVERQYPWVVKNSATASSRSSHNQSMSSLAKEFPVSEELKELLNKLDN